MKREVFYLIWIAIAFVQNSFTQLFPDEAYYWVYSQNMAWGYFDHPPMIAAIIKAGYFLFRSELGVRLICILLSTAFIYIMELLIAPVNNGLYYATVFTLGILHYYSVLALPDVPLIFFGACFFWVYKKYLETFSIFNAILLGVIIGMMLLSKYHGILIVLFTFLSFPAIIKKPSIWVAFFIAGIVFLPHMLWQIYNDFPTLKFHLSERAHEVYNVSLTLEFIGSQILIFGPITGIVLLYAAYRCKVSLPFEKALKFCLIGIPLFFIMMTFKGRAEANWTSIVIIPVLYLGYKQLEGNKMYVSAMRYLLPISVIIIFIVRIFFAHNLLPGLLQIDTGENSKEWALAVKKRAGDNPVVFMNSYQDAAEYEFYAGMPAFSIGNFRGRHSQYDLLNRECENQGKTVNVVPNYFLWGCDTFCTKRGCWQIVKLTDFRSYSNIRLHCSPEKLIVRSGDVFKADFNFTGSGICDIDCEHNIILLPVLKRVFYKQKKVYSDSVLSFKIDNAVLKSEKEHYSVSIQAPSEIGEYQLCLGISAGWLPPTINSNAIIVQVMAK